MAAACSELLDTFYANLRTVHVEKLVFSGVGGRDVYNITAPFPHDGEEVILGRVEERDSEFSQVFFLHPEGTGYGFPGHIRIPITCRTPVSPGLRAN